MAKRSNQVSAPLTFDLPESLIAKIEASRRHHGLKSVSETIRFALSEFDFESYKPAHDPHRQISVRIGTRQRLVLRRYAKRKSASVGELLRMAIESLPSRPAKKARA